MGAASTAHYKVAPLIQLGTLVLLSLKTQVTLLLGDLCCCPHPLDHLRMFPKAMLAFGCLT